jgi:hypothetical protein
MPMTKEKITAAKSRRTAQPDRSTAQPGTQCQIEFRLIQLKTAESILSYCKTSRLLASLPNLPHLEIGRLDVTSEALGVEQRMRQPVRGQSIAISLEK